MYFNTTIDVYVILESQTLVYVMNLTVFLFTA